MSRFPWLALLFFAGCTPTTAKVETPAPRVELGAAFDPAATGTIRGRVVWDGPLLNVPRATGVVPDGDDYRFREVANPFTPVVDPTTRGVTGLLLQLEDIDPARSRPWDHPPVTLTMADFAYRLSPPSGLVRLGESVTFVSRDPELHVVRARRSAYFSLTLPAPDQPRTRRMNLLGVVELTSGCGYFWNAVDLCVRVDPYAAMTDAQGRYEIPQVPDGNYWLTVSPRNPTVVRVERDPETGLPFRHYYGVGISRSIAVAVRRGEVATQAIIVDAAMYGGHQ